MPDPSNPTPDRMPLREALRALRHVLRQSGRAVRSAAPTDVLPQGAGRLADRLLGDVEDIARSLDTAASGLAERVLGEGSRPVLQLRSLAGRPEAGRAFSAAVYSGLRAALALLGAEEVFVSEAAARRAFEATATSAAEKAELAARLTLALVEARVIRDASVGAAARVPAGSLAPVSVFAVLLWLQSDRAQEDDDAALEAAVTLAVALSTDVRAAVEGADLDRLARLFDEFADHV